MRLILVAIYLTMLCATASSQATPEARQQKQDEKLDLEIENLQRSRHFPNTQNAPFFAALLAAIIALTVPFINAWRQLAADRRKDKVATVGEFIGKYAAAIHQIQWLTWRAKHEFETTECHVKDYDTEMSKLFPELISAFAKAVAFNPPLKTKLRDLFEIIVKTDLEIGKAYEANKSNQAALTKEFTTKYDYIDGHWKAAPEELANLVAAIEESH